MDTISAGQCRPMQAFQAGTLLAQGLGIEDGPLRNTAGEEEEENVEEEGNEQGTVSNDNMEHSVIVVAPRR